MRETPDPNRHPSLGSNVWPARPDTRPSMVIACDECAMQCTPTCDDCVVTFVMRVDDEQLDLLTLDVAEERAVRLLAQAGMIPALQYRLAVEGSTPTRGLASRTPSLDGACVMSNRSRRSTTSSCWRVSTASNTSGWPRPTCSVEPATPSTSARRQGSTLAWSSRTATRTDPPIRVEPSKAPDPSSSAPAPTWPTTPRRGPAGPARSGGEVRVDRPLRTVARGLASHQPADT